MNREKDEDPEIPADPEMDGGDTTPPRTLGQDSGIVAALTTLRANLKPPNVRGEAPAARTER